MRQKLSLFSALICCLTASPLFAEKSGVVIRISDFQRDSLQRLTAIKEATESPRITLDISIFNISYSKTSPSQVEGYRMNIRVLNISPKNYPPEGYQISNIKYSPIGRVASFEYFGKNMPQACVAAGTHHMTAPISRKNNTPPPMLPLSSQTRLAMGTLFGRDFQNVTVKTDSIKQRLAIEVQNEVFALGRDVYFFENGDQRITLPFRCTPKNPPPM